MRLSFPLSLLLMLTGCLLGDTENPIPAIDLEKVIVYYPLDGIVHGRGMPGAAPPGTNYVYVSARPSNSVTVRDILPDGSFVFSIAAASSDVLEIAAVEELSTNDEPDVRGTASYVQVPASPIFGTDFTCCIAAGAAQGTCQRIEAGQSCDLTEPAIIFTCTQDAECAQFSGQKINIPDGAFDLQPPGPARTAKLRANPGLLPPLSLIRIENRGQRGVGGYDPRYVSALVTNETGAFELDLPARGDDELVIRVYDFNGVRSRAHSMFVPDARLKGADITGVTPLPPGLKPGEYGKVAIRFSPFGEDNRGMCPDSAEGPALCFSGDTPTDGFVGGFDYSMVRVDRLEVDGALLDISKLRPVTTATSPEFPSRKYREKDSDLLRGEQTIMLIIDNSADSINNDLDDRRIQAALTVANSIRSADELGIWISGVTSEEDDYLEWQEPTSDRAVLTNRINELRGELALGSSDLVGGDATVMQAISAAAEKMRTTSVRTGSIVVLIAAEPGLGRAPGLYRDAADAALIDVIGDDTGLRQPYQTFSIIFAPSPNGGALTAGTITSIGGQTTLDDLNNISTFSGGSFRLIATPEDFLQEVGAAMGRIAGAFILVYELELPNTVGKAADLLIEAQITISDNTGAPISTSEMQGEKPTFRGTIRVADSLGVEN